MFIDKVSKVIKELVGYRSANEDLVKAYQRVFNTEDGKVVLTDLMKFSKLIEPAFVQGDEQSSIYFEGMRRVGIRILNFINIDLAKAQEVRDQLNEERVND